MLSCQCATAGEEYTRRDRRSLVLRITVVAVCLTAPALADTSAPSTMARTPLGPRCSAALEAARRAFRPDHPEWVEITVAPDEVRGSFDASDMCGVAVSCRFSLERDGRPARRWRKIERRGADDLHARSSRRARGWEATVEIEETGMSCDDFEALFRRALDVCLSPAEELRDRE
jgi:hypothetical protein